jgi:hemerythrin-like domain-containing protein
MEPKGRRVEGERRELVERLLECHVRIREVVTMASGIVTLATGDEARAAAERVGRYFRRGFVLHTCDEEESLIPRLVAPEVSAALEQMHREHSEHEPLVQRLVAACDGFVAAPPSQADPLREEIARAADALAPLLARHLEGEEDRVFPRVEALDPAMQAVILDEMDARRRASR